MRTSLCWVLLLSIPACKGSTESTGGEAKTEDTPLTRLMHEHSAKGAGMRDAVISAELPEVREYASWMLQHMDDPALPPEWEEHKRSMHDAAERAAFTVDVDVAARAVADVAAECGKCHDQLKDGPTISVGEAPSDDPSLGTRMKRHHWAAERLWDGLVGPSNEAWAKGAEVLASAPMTVEKIAFAGKEGDVERLMDEVHALAEQGKSTKGEEARAKLFGEFLTRCGKCHELFGLGKR